MSLTTQLLVTLGLNVALWAWVVLIPTWVLPSRALHLGGLGLALPGLTLLAPTARHESVLRHELAHQAQMRRYSPLGVALWLGWHYGLGFLRARRFSRQVFFELWRTNPLEQEANAAMEATTPLPPLFGWPMKS